MGGIRLRKRGELAAGGLKHVCLVLCRQQQRPVLQGKQGGNRLSITAKRGGQRVLLMQVFLDRMQRVAGDEPNPAGRIRREGEDRGGDLLHTGGRSPGERGEAQQTVRRRNPKHAGGFNVHVEELPGGDVLVLDRLPPPVVP